MKLLILGATGMLGHKLALELARDHVVYGTSRGGQNSFNALAAQRNITLVGHDDFSDAALTQLLDDVKPAYVINAIGIIKQHKNAATLEQLEINALLPQRLAVLCKSRGARFITFSTDCVFDGMLGRPYTLDDAPSAHDVYGMTKYLGEITDNDYALTLRTSIIGPELRAKKSLVEWVLSQRGKTVDGYTRALYTGLPTLEIANVLRHIFTHCPDLSGVWQVASAAIDKAALLRLISAQFELNIIVKNHDTFFCDRRLDGAAFAARTGYVPPAWPQLVAQMHADYLQYPVLYTDLAV